MPGSVQAASWLAVSDLFNQLGEQHTLGRTERQKQRVREPRPEAEAERQKERHWQTYSVSICCNLLGDLDHQCRLPLMHSVYRKRVAE